MFTEIFIFGSIHTSCTCLRNLYSLLQYSIIYDYVNCDFHAVGWHDQNIRETHHACNSERTINSTNNNSYYSTTIRAVSPGFSCSMKSSHN